MTMKTGWLLAMALCAGLAQAQANERAIQVEVVNGQIQVPEQTVRAGKQVGSFRWELATPGFTFPANGIVIDGGAFHNCRPIAQGRRFQCIRKGYQPGAQYKYDVNVNRGNQPLPTLDPIIQNE